MSKYCRRVLRKNFNSATASESGDRLSVPCGGFDASISACPEPWASSAHTTKRYHVSVEDAPAQQCICQIDSGSANPSSLVLRCPQILVEKLSRHPPARLQNRNNEPRQASMQRSRKGVYAGLTPNVAIT